MYNRELILEINYSSDNTCSISSITFSCASEVEEDFKRSPSSRAFSALEMEVSR